MSFAHLTPQIAAPNSKPSYSAPGGVKTVAGKSMIRVGKRREPIVKQLTGQAGKSLLDYVSDNSIRIKYEVLTINLSISDLRHQRLHLVAELKNSHLRELCN